MLKLFFVFIFLSIAIASIACESADNLKPVDVQSSLETKHHTTRFNIVNNQIIVPVVFRNNGRIVTAKMILDTGASVTTIYAKLASELNLGKNKLTIVKSTSANGSKTDTFMTKVDLIEVNDQLQANAEVIYMPVRSDFGADGLLGNSFLQLFNFTIDYNNRLIRWN